MRKAISMLLVLVLAIGMMAGCGTKSTSENTKKDTPAATGDDKTATPTETAETAEPVTIEFWTISLQPTFTDFFNGLIKDYEAANPGVTVNWTDLPYDSIQQKLVTAAAGGTSPDVVNLNTQMALTLAGKGALVDLEAEATAEQKSIYVKSLYDSAKIGNSVYAFPWYASPNIMFYNKELFEKAGLTEIPSKYQDAFEMAKTMKDKTGAYLYNPPEFFSLLFEQGIPILNTDSTAAAFNTPDTVNLLQSFKDMTDAGYLPKTNWGSWDNELKLFETGKLATISSSGSSLSRIKDEAPDVYEKICIATPMTGSIGLSRNPLMNVVVPEASKNHTEAIKFASFITNDASQLAFCKQVAIFPSTTAASEDPYFESDTATLEGIARKMSVDISKTSKDYSLGIEDQGDVQSGVNKVYEAVIINGADIQKTLDAQEKAVNSVLQK
ncbi:ABC transporter substrate-binding protein [Anaerocolumna xylanovorans]|uniref:Putative chitobiose transport system substrate-binding protein n=1 Tax=Anaerocolumna xylanovorans DSM 12503 TaxID=1121345 RepID=A0A1M7XWC4_9FIRM|nr:sugar ABC transporter substrate-binding protein [Anaerocolumna xylanovorans]SHO43044.1 putative chitobiose transport system substrate-binding protein [Anaerocolumna xylanovorans DSM 12503]